MAQQFPSASTNRAHPQKHRSRSPHSNYNPRRRSVVAFGQSLILDRQNPSWQYPAAPTNSVCFHHHQQQQCYCAGVGDFSYSPWVHKRLQIDASNKANLPSPAAEGYQTLPPKMASWSHGDALTPPRPPIRTSSKLQPPALLLSYYGQQRDSRDLEFHPINYVSQIFRTSLFLVH